MSDQLEESRLKSRAIWDEMAAGWERHHDFVWGATRAVGEWMVDALEPQPGQTILDLAAGPGETGFVAARLIGNEGRLISTDFAQQMVDVARRRAEQLGLSNTEFAVMDAENMDLDDDTVDGVLCRWGFMLMLDPRKAIAETRRVLRPGGKLVFSVWGPPDRNPWVTLMGMVMIQHGHPPQSDPFGPGGMFSLSDPTTIEAAVAGAGFSNVRIEEMPVDWRFADFDAVWAFATELAGAIAAVVKQLPEDEVGEIKSAAEEAAQAFRAEDGYLFPGLTLNVCCS